MTRSVEIPAEAVRDAIAAFDDFEMRAMNAVEDQDAHFEDAMRVALAAALPYLAPAARLDRREVMKTLLEFHSVTRIPSPSIAELQDPADSLMALAPAGDGGLREALEELVDQWQYSDGKGFRGFYEDAQSLLAAHPAAPAVLQPVDREALERLFETHGVFETTFISTEIVEGRRRTLSEAVADLLNGSEEKT